MAESTTTRLGLARWTAGTDTPNRAEFDQSNANLEAKAAGFLEGTLAARPAAAAANTGFFYKRTDGEGEIYYSNGVAWVQIYPVLQTAVFAKAGTLEVATGKGVFLVPQAIKVVDVRAVVGTAPTGASILVDVNKNGTTIFSTQGNRPTIASGATTSGAAVPDITTFAANDKMVVDVDQVGSTVPGADLTVVVRYYMTL